MRSDEEVRRADPQRVKRADPQRVKTSQKQSDAAAATSPDQQFDDETVENEISHSTVQDVRGQNKTRIRDVTTTRANDPIYVADSSDQDELEDAKKTVEVP